MNMAEAYVAEQDKLQKVYDRVKFEKQMLNFLKDPVSHVADTYNKAVADRNWKVAEQRKIDNSLYGDRGLEPILTVVPVGGAQTMIRNAVEGGVNYGTNQVVPQAHPYSKLEAVLTSKKSK